MTPSLCCWRRTAPSAEAMVCNNGLYDPNTSLDLILKVTSVLQRQDLAKNPSPIDSLCLADLSNGFVSSATCGRNLLSLKL